MTWLIVVIVIFIALFLWVLRINRKDLHEIYKELESDDEHEDNKVQVIEDLPKQT